MPAITYPTLHKLRTRIKEIMPDKFKGDYVMPARWLSANNQAHAININPYAVWLNTIDWIVEQPATDCIVNPKAQGGAWSRYAVVYNLFVRSATAFDHDQDGTLTYPNPNGFNEIGTFVKSLLLLRYIQELGCNTVHLLPITAVGQDGNKGDLGSPYAIRNPYKLDGNLAEPSLGLGAEAEFKAFVEAAHHLGIKVVMEFVFRTSSKDGDWVKEHPEWFYWIKADTPDRQPSSQEENHYGMPIFTETEATHIKEAVAREQFANLIPPHQVHQDLFLPAPQPQQVKMAEGAWQATYKDKQMGRIPGAFADWPIDDPQPPWGDVTYLRLYDHLNYNYIAYNTVRMYSTELAQPDNAVQPLWERIINIIPHYQKEFGIDGAMIDMGHALPPALKAEMVKVARKNDPDFAFWDENFKATDAGKAEGYNAVIGSLPFVLTERQELEEYLIHLAYNGTPLPIFSTAESHNTPRAITKEGGERYVKLAIAVGAFLPAIPFIHNGAEFGEIVPINTGLGFTPEETTQYPSQTLPLFSAVAYNWTNDNSNLIAWWRQTLTLRQCYVTTLSDTRSNTFIYTYSDNQYIWGIIRHNDDWSIKVALLVNQDMHHTQTVWMRLPTGREKLMDHYTDTYYDVNNNHIYVVLQPGQCIWLEL